MTEKQKIASSIRVAKGGDATILHALASSCPPLTLHTPFTYWVIVFNYPDYIFILEDAGKPMGFISAIPSEERDGVFIWQIGILPQYRGQGFSKELIRALLENHRRHKRFIVTIDPDNKPSMTAFISAAAEYGTTLQEWQDPAFAVDAALLKKEDNELVFSMALDG